MAQLVQALPYKFECRGFSIVSLEFFIDIILQAALWPGFTQTLPEVSTRNISWG